MVESAVTEAPTQLPAGVRPVSPAAHLSDVFTAATVTGPQGVRLRELPFLTMIGVRVVPGTAGAIRIEAALGTELPARCGAVGTAAGNQVLWLAPDEFLVVSDDQPASVSSALGQALAGDPGSVIDLSANRTTFELAGPRARAVLEKGCPLDLHPREFAVGSAYVTAIGSVPVLLWKVEPEVFRILPRASFADFLSRWLVDAMTEFTAAGLSALESSRWR
jgi:sarcosine oxidase subunit gamma